MNFQLKLIVIKNNKPYKIYYNNFNNSCNNKINNKLSSQMKNGLISSKRLLQISNLINGFSLLNPKSYRYFMHQHVIIIPLNRSLLSIMLRRRLFLNVVLTNLLTFILINSREMKKYI